MRDQGPILVPLDGSELAEGALAYATALAGALRTHLVLCTAWEGTESEISGAFPAIATEVEKNAHDYYTEYLNGIRARLGGGEQMRTIVRAGDAATEILRAADETGARMIVIATHGRSGIGRWVYGSTASRLLRESTAPIVAVGPQALQRAASGVTMKRIMVALDGSPSSEAALPVAASLATALGASVLLVRCVRWAVQAYPYALPDAYVPQVDEELEAGAKAYLRRQEETLKGKVDVAAFVVRGAIAEGLIDFVEKEQSDLVIMTTHARSGIARAVLGSTADRMIQGRAPVMLLPPDAK